MITQYIPKLGILLNPDDMVYINYPLNNGKNVQVHYLALKTEEFINNIIIANKLSEHGYDNIRLLPQIHAEEIELRKRYFGIDYEKKHLNSNPDAIIDGHLFEFKTSNKKKFIVRLNEALNQSDSIIILLNEKLTKEYIFRRIEKIIEKTSLKFRVLIINVDELIEIKNAGI